MRKIIVLVVILNLFGNVTNAQIGNWQWARGAGGTNIDTACSIVTTSTGVYVVGNFASPTITFGTIVLNNASTSLTTDMCVVKYDFTGTVLWAIKVGGTSDDKVRSITADASGNIYIVGSFASSTITFGSSTILTNASSVGTSDIFIAKYNSSGNLIWADRAGGNGDDEATSITVDATGLYITGDFDSPSISFGSTVLTNIFGSKAFIAKYTLSGVIYWAKGSTSYSGIYERSTSITKDATGEYITGWFTSKKIIFGTDSLIITDSTITNMFIAKFDINGNTLWVRGASGTSYSNWLIANSITSDITGVYVTGYFQDTSVTFGTLTLTSPIYFNYKTVFLVKYDISGNVLWGKTISGGIDEAKYVTTDATGIYMTGYFESPSITIGSTTLLNFSSLTAWEWDMFIAKYDTSGNVLWAVSNGTEGQDIGEAIAVDATGIYVTGWYFNPTYTFGSSSLTSYGDYDMFVAKLDATTGIKEINNQQSEISIFPNPTTSTFTVTSKINIKCLKVYDVLGGLIRNYELGIRNNSSATIDITGVAKGIYFVEIKTETGVERRKIVKE